MAKNTHQNPVKILVTGSNGQLGNEIRKRESQFSNMQFLFTDINELDITSIDAIQDFFERENPDWIINCAAYTAVDNAEEDMEKAELINHFAVRNLKEIAEYKDIPIIHISTDYVFDGRNYRPYTEDDMAIPASVYGKTKLAGEEALKDYQQSFIIRTSWLYSSFGFNFVKTMIRLGKERDRLTVIFDQTGTPTYAGDLAYACLTIIDKTQKDNHCFYPGIYHFSNEGVCSWYDFACEIVAIAKLKVDILPVESKAFPQKAPRPFYSVMNKARIKNNYNISIPHWKDSLKKCIFEL